MTGTLGSKQQLLWQTRVIIITLETSVTVYSSKCVDADQG